MTSRSPKKSALEAAARGSLEGVGDPANEWVEFTGKAFHLRRRLTESEQESTGPAADLRGTEEGKGRLRAALLSMPEHLREWSVEEFLMTQQPMH